MTTEDLLAKLDIEDAKIHETPNGEDYFVAVRREHNGQPRSHSVRIRKDPTDTEITFIQQVFKIWWDNETATP